MTTHDDNWRKANELADELRDLHGTGARANLIFEALQEARRETTNKWKQKLADVGDRLEEGDFDGHDDLAFVCEAICELMDEMEGSE